MTLTVLVQWQFVEPESTGLFAHKVVSVLTAEVMHGDGILQRFNARLQTKRNFCVTHRVSAAHREAWEKTQKPKKASKQKWEACWPCTSWRLWEWKNTKWLEGHNFNLLGDRPKVFCCMILFFLKLTLRLVSHCTLCSVCEKKKSLILTKPFWGTKWTRAALR